MKRWLGTLLLFAWSFTVALAAETLEGNWKGSVDCIGQGKIKLRLSIKEANGRLTGEVEFRRGAVKSGYTLDGAQVIDNKFILKPGKWTSTSLNIAPSDIDGEFFSIGTKIGIHGTLRVCRQGIFSAFREREREQPTPAPPRIQLRERNVAALTRSVREGIKVLTARADRTTRWWRSLEHGILFSRVDQATKDTLLREVQEAKANVFADWLLEKELVSGPTVFPTGVGRAIYVFREARKTDWPDKVKLRVYKECQKRVTDVLRPELKQIAKLVGKLPVSLDGLIQARAALNRVDAYKASLEEAFGTLDQENILPATRHRIAEMERSPLVADQLQARLESILKQPKPRSATERLLLDVSGFEPLTEPLATVMRDGWRKAAFAEVIISDGGSGGSPFEPSAQDIAWHVFGIYERENSRVAKKTCNPGIVYDAWTWGQCAVGETRMRLNELSKISCVETDPKKSYICHFRQNADWLAFRTGEVLQSTTGKTSARFVRTAQGEWQGSELGVQ